MSDEHLSPRCTNIFNLLMKLKGEGYVFKDIVEELGWISYEQHLSEKNIKRLETTIAQNLNNE